jgi:hypothetical protein
VPLILHTRRGQSLNTSLVYYHDDDDANAAAEGKDSDPNNKNDNNITQDKVEDFYQALNKDG